MTSPLHFTNIRKDSPRRGRDSKISRELRVGLFFNYSSTLAAHRKLLTSGHRSRDISLVMTAETWKKHFLDALENAPVKSEVGTGSSPELSHLMPQQNPSPIKALIRSATVLPGLDMLVAGPVGRQMAASEVSGAGLVGAFRKWGLPRPLAVQFEKTILCGGIMVGAGVQRSEPEKHATPHRSSVGTAHVNLLTAADSAHTWSGQPV